MPLWLGLIWAISIISWSRCLQAKDQKFCINFTLSELVALVISWNMQRCAYLIPATVSILSTMRNDRRKWCIIFWIYDIVDIIICAARRLRRISGGYGGGLCSRFFCFVRFGCGVGGVGSGGRRFFGASVIYQSCVRLILVFVAVVVFLNDICVRRCARCRQRHICSCRFVVQRSRRSWHFGGFVCVRVPYSHPVRFSLQQPPLSALRRVRWEQSHFLNPAKQSICCLDIFVCMWCVCVWNGGGENWLPSIHDSHKKWNDCVAIILMSFVEGMESETRKKKLIKNCAKR